MWDICRRTYCGAFALKRLVGCLPLELCAGYLHWKVLWDLWLGTSCGIAILGAGPCLVCGSTRCSIAAVVASTTRPLRTCFASMLVGCSTQVRLRQKGAGGPADGEVKRRARPHLFSRVSDNAGRGVLATCNAEVATRRAQYRERGTSHVYDSGARNNGAISRNNSSISRNNSSNSRNTVFQKAQSPQHNRSTKIAPRKPSNASKQRSSRRALGRAWAAHVEQRAGGLGAILLFLCLYCPAARLRLGNSSASLVASDEEGAARSHTSVAVSCMRLALSCLCVAFECCGVCFTHCHVAFVCFCCASSRVEVAFGCFLLRFSVCGALPSPRRRRSELRAPPMCCVRALFLALLCVCWWRGCFAWLRCSFVVWRFWLAVLERSLRVLSFLLWLFCLRSPCS